MLVHIYELSECANKLSMLKNKLNKMKLGKSEGMYAGDKMMFSSANLAW